MANTTKLVFNPLSGNFDTVVDVVDAAKIANGSVSNTEFQYLNGATSNIQDQLDDKEETANKGVANGYAPLNASTKIDAIYLPSNIMEYLGTWNATTNTPTLADGTGAAGNVYLVSVAGTQNLGSGSLTFQVGDWVVHNGTIWEQSPSGDDVLSVHGRVGIVVSANGDYTASQVTNVPSGNLAAVTVQAALNELQSDVDGRLTPAGSETLTNKTIDADLNTITDIANANIKASAAIDGSKINPLFTALLEAPGIKNTSQLIVETQVIAGTGSLVFDLLGDTSTFLVVYQTVNGDELKLPSAAVDGRVIKVILAATSSGVPVSLLITSNGGNFGLEGSPTSFLLESAYQSLTFVSVSNTWYIL